MKANPSFNSKFSKDFYIANQKSLLTLGILAFLSSLSFGSLSLSSENQPTEIANAGIRDFYARYNTSRDALREKVPALGFNDLCIADKEDPLDLGALMPIGKFKGECIDAGGNRPVIILKEEKSQDGKSPGDVTIGNLRFQGRFWIAKIKSNSIKNVQYEIVNFGKMKLKPFGRNLDVLTAHTQVRYLFSTPIELESQVVTESGTRDKTTLDDLTFTYNAFGVNGVGYDIMAGISGTFALVGKAIATIDRSVEEIVWDKSKVALYDMDFSKINQLTGRTSEENMYHYLLTNFHHSQTMGFKTFYHTAFRNCTTEAFDAMDEAFPELLASNHAEGEALPFLQSYYPKSDYLVEPNHLFLKLKADLNDATNFSLSSPLNKHLFDKFEFSDSKWGKKLSEFGDRMKSKSEVYLQKTKETAFGKFMIRMDDALENYDVKDYFPKVLGTLNQIEDLAEKPSIRNLNDRGFWPSINPSSVYLNSEFSALDSDPTLKDTDGVVKASHYICQITKCGDVNFRHPGNPTTGVKAHVEAAEAAEAAAKAAKAAAKAAKNADAEAK